MSPVKVKGKAKANDVLGRRSVPAPQWPLLRPLVPTSDLCLEPVLDEQIVLIHNFFTTSLCRQYVSFLSTLPLVTTPNVPKKGEALRVNDRFQVEDFGFSQRLWSDTGLKNLLTGAASDWGGELCGLNPRIRIYRYRENQFFDQHYDESNVLLLPTEPPIPAKTTWTLLIYLTGPVSGCIGGETVFYPELGKARDFSEKSSGETEPIVITPEVGMALLHKHGNDCLLHEGRKVTAGEKWIIRSDLCVIR